jgi:hypothetical protein
VPAVFGVLPELLGFGGVKREAGEAFQRNAIPALPTQR